MKIKQNILNIKKNNKILDFIIVILICLNIFILNNLAFGKDSRWSLIKLIDPTKNEESILLFFTQVTLALSLIKIIKYHFNIGLIQKGIFHFENIRIISIILSIYSLYYYYIRVDYIELEAGACFYIFISIILFILIYAIKKNIMYIEHLININEKELIAQKQQEELMTLIKKMSNEQIEKILTDPKYYKDSIVYWCQKEFEQRNNILIEDENNSSINEDLTYLLPQKESTKKHILTFVIFFIILHLCVLITG